MQSQFAKSIRQSGNWRSYVVGVIAAWITISSALSAQQESDVFADDLVAPQPDDFQSSGDGRISEIKIGKFKPITEVGAGITITGEAPEDRSGDIFQGSGPALARTDNMIAFHWEPTNFFHYPLYFDDTPLERYGQSICPKYQPFISTSRFFLTFPVLPYKMGVDRVHDCVSTLGYYRPGSCAPNLRERVVPAWERDAALLEVGMAMALVFALP